MDTATHTLFGATASGLLPAARNRWRLAVLVIVASVLPDIDILWAFSDPISAVLNRRMFTHSVSGIVIMSIVIAFLVRKLFPGTSVWLLASLAAAAMSMHVLLDLINAYGVGLFYPFSTARLDFPLVFVIDPILLLIGVITLVTCGMASSLAGKRVRALTGLAAACLYLLVCLASKLVALDMARSSNTVTPDQVRLETIIPEPFAPLRWRAIVPVANGYRQMGLFPFSGTLTDLGFTPEAGTGADIATIRNSDIAARLQPSLKFPVWETMCGNVVVHDLRYRYATLQNDWDPFGFSFKPDAEGGRVELIVPETRRQVDRSLDVLAAIDWWAFLAGNTLPHHSDQKPSC